LKLLKQDDQSFTFRIGKRERELFLAILLRYPVLSTQYFEKRRSAPSEETSADDALLREALAEQ
jgi:hypothetical protein